MTENPYKSPKACGYMDPRKRYYRLSGPLLLLSTLSLIMTAATIMAVGAMYVAPEHEWLRIAALVISAASAVFGLICLGLSFHLYRRLKQTNREWTAV